LFYVFHSVVYLVRNNLLLKLTELVGKRTCMWT